MKKIISIIAMLIVATTGITKAQDAALVDEVKKSLELQKMRENLIEGTKAQYQTIANSGQVAFDDVNALATEMVDVIYDQLTEKVIAFYCENYTLEEMKAFNAFLASPVGQKNVSLQPQLNAISFQLQSDPTKAVFMQTIMAKHIQR